MDASDLLSFFLAFWLAGCPHSPPASLLTSTPTPAVILLYLSSRWELLLSSATSAEHPPNCCLSTQVLFNHTAKILRELGLFAAHRKTHLWADMSTCLFLYSVHIKLCFSICASEIPKHQTQGLCWNTKYKPSASLLATTIKIFLFVNSAQLTGIIMRIFKGTNFLSTQTKVLADLLYEAQHCCNTTANFIARVTRHYSVQGIPDNFSSCNSSSGFTLNYQNKTFHQDISVLQMVKTSESTNLRWILVF